MFIIKIIIDNNFISIIINNNFFNKNTISHNYKSKNKIKVILYLRKIKIKKDNEKWIKKW